MGDEVILDFDIIDGWYDELKRMNEGKRGAAYDYPDSFVQLLATSMLVPNITSMLFLSSWFHCVRCGKSNREDLIRSNN